MALLEFSLARIENVDGGRVVEAFDELVRRAIADCEDRPGAKTARAVSLTLSLKPRVRDNGEAYEIAFGFAVAAKIPTTQSPAYIGAIRHGNKGLGFVFDDLTGDPAQLGLDADSDAFDD